MTWRDEVRADVVLGPDGAGGNCAKRAVTAGAWPPSSPDRRDRGDQPPVVAGLVCLSLDRIGSIIATPRALA